MYLYVIENCDNGLVKIGHSLDPDRRCASLQTGSSADLRVAHRAAVDPARAAVLERKLHQEMAHVRVRGEWFSLDAKLAANLVEHCVIRWHDDILLD